MSSPILWQNCQNIHFNRENCQMPCCSANGRHPGRGSPSHHTRAVLTSQHQEAGTLIPSRKARNPALQSGCLGSGSNALLAAEPWASCWTRVSEAHHAILMLSHTQNENIPTSEDWVRECYQKKSRETTQPHAQQRPRLTAVTILLISELLAIKSQRAQNTINSRIKSHFLVTIDFNN